MVHGASATDPNLTRLIKVLIISIWHTSNPIEIRQRTIGDRDALQI